jgi:hypothetical protein
MVTADEKLLLGSDNVIDTVLKSCIVDPTDIDMSTMTTTDRHFLLIKLRTLSYGEEYHVEVNCSECGKRQEVAVNLEKLPVTLLEDGFVEPYMEFELPVSKMKIGLRVPRMRDLDDVDDKAKRFHRKFPEAKGDVAYIYRLMMHIMTIDGEEPGRDLQQIIEGWPVRDSSFFKKKINELKVGYDTEVFHTCINSDCREEFDFDLPIGANFFRTRYSD